MEHITTESLRNDVLKLAQKQYGTAPDYLWMKDPKSAVLRHSDSKKWYAVLMEIPKKTPGPSRRRQRGHSEFKGRSHNVRFTFAAAGDSSRIQYA